MKVNFRASRKRFKNWCIYIIVKFFVNLLRWMSRPRAIKVMKGLALIAFYLAAKERKKTIRHLSLVYGGIKSEKEIKLMARKVFKNLGRNATDAIRLPVVMRNGIESIVKAQGMEHMDAALARGKGVVALTAHLGNWELLGAWLASEGYPLNVVGAPVYDPRLDKMLVLGRNTAGYKNIARGKATREILRALRKGEVVGILIDQDTRVDGVFAEFFGKKAHTPTGPIVLAQKTGAAIVPIFIHICDDNIHLIECGEEIKLESTDDHDRDMLVNAQKYNDVYEKVIRRYPTQWVWMHERWKKTEAIE